MMVIDFGLIGEIKGKVGDFDITKYLRGGGFEGRRVLEVGCGSGENVGWMRGMGIEGYGIDRCRVSIGEAVGRGYGEWVRFGEVREMEGKWAGVVDVECLCYCGESEWEAVYRGLEVGGVLISKWFRAKPEGVGHVDGVRVFDTEVEGIMRGIFDEVHISYEVRRSNGSWYDVREVVWQGIKLRGS